MRIFKNAWFARFARKQGLSNDALKRAIERVEKGQIDADLGGGVLKQRVPRPGQGKSGGYRTIILYRRAERAFFVYGFAKNDRGNIDRMEEEAFKKAARHVLTLSERHLAELVGKGQMVEVGDDDDEEVQE